MALPQQKKFSLDEATKWIEKKTGDPCNLLELAKNDQIYISIHKQDWEYVRTDEEPYEMENVSCSVLGIKLVAPKDRRSVTGLASTFEGWQETIFPFIQSTDLKRIDSDGNTSIIPYGLTAYYNEKKIKVAIVESTRFPKEGDAEYNNFMTWLTGLGGYATILKRQNDNSKPIDPSEYLKEGFYYKLKGSEGGFIPRVTINQKDFCITRQALDAYIHRQQAEKSRPDRIQEAITEIKEKTGRTFTKNQLYRKAKTGELHISFSKPSQALQYIQMDLPENEYTTLHCEPLHSDLIVPKSREALPEYQEVFNSVDESIYPILEGQSLIDVADLNKTQTQIRAWNIPAKDKKGNNLEVTSFYRYLFRDENEYSIFKEWLNKHSLPDHFAQSIEYVPDDENIIQTGVVFLVNGIFIELDILDLFIPPFSLEQFIQNILSEQNKQASAPVIVAQHKENNNKKEWELTESEYKKLKAYELIPLIMKSLNIDPMAYPRQHNKSGLKREIHTKGYELFNKRFRMTVESFSKGNNSAWSKAKSNNLIKEA